MSLRLQYIQRHPGVIIFTIAYHPLPRPNLRGLHRNFGLRLALADVSGRSFVAIFPGDFQRTAPLDGAELGWEDMQDSQSYIYTWFEVSKTCFIFHSIHVIYGIILPIDFHIFQDGFSTTKQIFLNGEKKGFSVKFDPSESSLNLCQISLWDEWNLKIRSTQGWLFPCFVNSCFTW